MSMKNRQLLFLFLLGSILIGACGRVASNSEAIQSGQGSQASFNETLNPTQIHETQLAVMEATGIAADFPLTQVAFDLQTVEAGGVLPTSAATMDAETASWATALASGATLTPEPLFSEGQCDSMEDAPDGYVAGQGNCWVVNDWQRQESYTVYTGVLWEDPMQGGITFSRVGGNLTYLEMRPVDVLAPQKQGVIMVESATWPLVYITTQTKPTQHLIFNLETRQWLNPNGTPMPITATPTSTSEPTVATPTPAGGITVTSLTLFNADTDQPLIGFDPMDTPTILDFVALGTRRLNIRANTSPATVGSVRFSLDGAPYRIEGGAPYALQGNTGNDYAAWTPSAGQHQLVVTAFSGANATGTQGGSFTLDFTVVDSATATTAPATATATGIPASITPVPATPTSTGSTSTPSAAKTALFVVGDASALNAGEGYTVSLKSAAQSSSADAAGKQLVLISSSVSAGNVGTKFTNVAVPVIVWEHAIYDDLGMTGPTTTTDYGTATGNSLVISNATHGLAGGLSGTITVYTGSGSMAYGVPASSAISIAPQGSSNSKKVYFGYEQGATMVGSVVAPARRVGLFLSDSGTLSSDGQTLVKAAFAWATGQ